MPLEAPSAAPLPPRPRPCVPLRAPTVPIFIDPAPHPHTTPHRPRTLLLASASRASMRLRPTHLSGRHFSHSNVPVFMYPCPALSLPPKAACRRPSPYTHVPEPRGDVTATTAVKWPTTNASVRAVVARTSARLVHCNHCSAPASAWRHPGRGSRPCFVGIRALGVAQNHDNMRQAYAPRNRRGGIQPGRGLSRPTACGRGTAAVVPELSPSRVGGYVWAMAKV